MEMVKATVTQVSPLTVTIEGATKAAPGVLVSGTPVAGATCYLAFLPGGNQPPLVFVPGAAGGGGAAGDSAWHVLGAAGEPALQGAWTNFGGSHATAAFRKDASGYVHLRGLIKGGAAGGAVIFTLPVGYRPAVQLALGVGQSNGTVAEMDIDPAGNVMWWGVAAPGFAMFDGLVFLGEQ